MINSVNFVSNVIKLTSGSFFGQLVFISTTPVITRIYDPEVFGFFAIYSAIVRLVSGISPLRYEIAILIAESIKLFPIILYNPPMMWLVLVGLSWWLHLCSQKFQCLL